MGEWITENWFNVLSAIGIIGGLVFTAVSLRSETRTRRVGNLLALTGNHREIWSELLHNAKLKRVLDASPDLSAEPPTDDEAVFVNMVIQQLSSAFEAMKAGLTIKPEGLVQDVWEFFSLPIPRTVWEKLKSMQNDDFMEFVERFRVSGGPKKVERAKEIKRA